MRRLFAEVPEACDNTLLIAERAAVEIAFGKPDLPEFPVPAGVHRSHLRGVAPTPTCATWRSPARAERYGEQLPAAVAERLDYELSVIASMGFSAYFLVVWDLIRFARESGIRVGPGRGSSAGCCVAYCLKIVDLDPIRYGLLFERFLNPGRKEMPDIDMDFDERYRGDVIRYAVGALRLGPRGPGGDVLHHQGPGRRARRGAGPRLPLHRGRQDREGHAAARHGTRHAAQCLLRGAARLRRRLQGGDRAAARCTPRTPRPSG